MRKYIGRGEFIPGVPARDLSDEEWAEHVKAGRLTEKSPLYEKAGEKTTGREKPSQEQEVSDDANR